MPETALALIDTLTPEIFVPGAIDPILEKIKTEVRARAAELDISTPFNRSELASLAYKVARSKTGVDNLRKSVVAAEKKRLARIDAEGKRIWDELESLQLEIRKPLTDWEKLEDARVEQHQRTLHEIEEAGRITLERWNAFSSETIRDRIREIETDSRDWQEFAGRHAGVKTIALKQLWDALCLREAHDEEQAELARLRKESAEREQKEREERLVREAEERIERARIEAEKKAKFAEEYAKQQAERHAEELKAHEERAERQRLAAIQAEKDRVEREAQAELAAKDARENDFAHRKAVNSAALAGFVKCGLSYSAATEALRAVVAGKIPHVTINY